MFEPLLHYAFALELPFVRYLVSDNAGEKVAVSELTFAWHLFDESVWEVGEASRELNNPMIIRRYFQGSANRASDRTTARGRAMN